MGVNGIYGLSGSGLDVESMVKVGMMSKQNELEKMQQKYTLNEWKKTEYLDLYSEVQTFNNSTLSQYKLSSTMNARSASSSNEAAVTATANGNAAPMQHYVEVGQLASAAYLIGTQSVTRLDGSTSTELQNALFKSLEKDGDTYTFVDSSGNTTTGLSASDIAFTFRIGDGTQTTANLLTTNDDIFTASMQSGHAASDTSSHTVKVDLADPPVMTTSGVSITSSTAMSWVFKTLLNDSNDRYITQRLNRLAKDSTIKDNTAFTINFYDQNSTTSIGSVSFAYSDLTSSNSFYTHIQNQLSSADITVSLNTDSSLSFTNANATGSDSYIQFSLDASNFDLGFNETDTNTQNLSMYPLASSTGLNLTTNTTLKDAFAQLLSGSSNTSVYSSTAHTSAMSYINAHSNSSEIALTFTVTDENGRTNRIDVAFSDMAKTDVTFLNFINSKLDSVFDDPSGNTTGGEAKITISDGQLKITDGEYGASNTLTASVALNKIGTTGYEYPLSNPADVTLPNQTISDFVSSQFGINVDKYIATLKNSAILNSTPFNSTATIFSIQIADGTSGTNSSTTIDIAASDLTDTNVTLWSKIENNLPTNITASFYNDSTITFSNSKIGSGNKIDISFVGTTTLNTQALATSGITDENQTLAKLLLGQDVDISSYKFKNDTATSSTASSDAVFELTYNYGTSSTTGTVYINYQDLNKNLSTLLKEKLSDTNLTAMYGYTDKEDSKQIILVNTITGSTSTINSLSWTSNIAKDIGTYPNDVTVSSTETVKGSLSISDTDIFKDLASDPSVSTGTAISVTFNDGSNTSTTNITWAEIAAASDSIISTLLSKVTGNSSTNITATVSDNKITFSNPNIYENAQITITTSVSSISDSYTFPPTALNLDNYFSTDYTPSNGYATLTFTNTETVKSAFGITEADNDKIAALASNTGTAYTFQVNSGTAVAVTWAELFASEGTATVSSILYNKLKNATGTGIKTDNNDVSSTVTFTNTPPTVSITAGATVSGESYSTTMPSFSSYSSTSTELASTKITFTSGQNQTISNAFGIDDNETDALKSDTTTAFTINVNGSETTVAWSDLVTASTTYVADFLTNKLSNATIGTDVSVTTDTNSVTFTNSTPITSSTTASTATISYTVDVSNLATTLFGGIGSSPATQATLTESDVTSLFSTTYNGGTYTKSGAIVNSTTGVSPSETSALTANLDNLFKQTRAGDDGSGDVANNPNYTQATLIDKIGKFFGGNAYDSDNNKAFVSGQSGSITIDGTSYALNRAESNTYTASDGIIYTLNSDGEALSNITDSGETISVTYAQLASGYTFNDLVSEINSLGLNVRATYDSVQDRFSIYNKESGAENSIIIGFDIYSTDTTVNSAIDRTAAFFQNMGLRQTENGVLDTEAGTGGSTTDIDFEFEAGKTSILTGKNAIAKIDGIDYNDLSKNNVTVNGVTYNFNAVTNTDIDTTTSTINSSSDVSKVAVTVTQDTAAIASKVKSFVEEYNTILKKLYEWYDEKPNEKYKPLTASQKEGMKDEQIEKWEEKAKAGMLYHDKTLFSIINQMRSVISEKIEGITGNYNTIFSLGVSTTGTKGQLKLDEDKLNAALANDPDAVYNIFSKLDKGETQYYVKVGNNYIWTTNQSAGELQYDKDGNPRTKTVERSSYNGIAQRLSDILNTGMKSLKTVAGSSGEITEDSDLNNLLRDLQTKMSNFQRMMQAFETRLYKKYDAMESALALLGAQLNYVTGAFQ